MTAEILFRDGTKTTHFFNGETIAEVIADATTLAETGLDEREIEKITLPLPKDLT